MIPTSDRMTNVIDVTWRPAGASALQMDRYAAESLGYPGPGSLDEIEARVSQAARELYAGRGEVLQVYYISIDFGDGESFGRRFWQDPAFKPRARGSRRKA